MNKMSLRFAVGLVVLQCVAVCCSVLQCAAVCCSVLQCVAVCCSVLQRVCEFAIRFCGQQLARQGRQDPFICKGLGLGLGCKRDTLQHTLQHNNT